MANSILIIGESGTGKSTSLRNLNPKETVIVNVAEKPLPIKGWKKNYSTLSKENPTGNVLNYRDADKIIAALKRISENRPEVKTIIIDDFQYLSSFEYFDRAKERGYDKFVDIATSLAKIARVPLHLREDLDIFFLTHSETSVDINGNKKVKAKTVGKMIDNALTLEGLFSIVFHTRVKKTESGLEYGFETQTDGDTTAKSPMGMFEDSFIPNDLQFVKDKIKEYES